MPFADDVNLSALPELADRMALIDVFEQPQRFRFSMVGRELARQGQDIVAGRFIMNCNCGRPCNTCRRRVVRRWKVRSLRSISALERARRECSHPNRIRVCCCRHGALVRSLCCLACGVRWQRVEWRYA